MDDKSLTEVLKKHQKMLGKDVVIEKPVKHISKDRGIVDLMLSRAIRRYKANDIEHLVVELKRPKVVVDKDEVIQIEEYAMSVATDPRFKKVNGVRWSFWVLSDDLGKYAEHRIINDNDRGVISDKDNMIIDVKTWSQVIEENKARLQFFQEKLEHQVDQGTALKHLQDKYQELLKGVVTQNVIEERLEETDDENKELVIAK